MAALTMHLQITRQKKRNHLQKPADLPPAVHEANKIKAPASDSNKANYDELKSANINALLSRGLKRRRCGVFCGLRRRCRLRKMEEKIKKAAAPRYKTAKRGRNNNTKVKIRTDRFNQPSCFGPRALLPADKCCLIIFN
jgi:hypothetical protein